VGAGGKQLKNHSSIESAGQRNANSTPFFSIGVTTYNRPELLKQTLMSIRAQTFSDFEVIVGNDYIQEPLSAESLGIMDSRIRFINHPQNLGEARNMNTLLNLSQGRYFTWQCDDDLYAPNFLGEVHSALIKFNCPTCVFTDYELIYGTSFHKTTKTLSGKGQIFSGRQFLRMYWSEKLKAMGCTGVYDKEYLIQLGGVECLTDTSTPLYSEHLLLVRAGLLDQVVYIDEPLVIFRVHEGSWGCSAKDLALFKQAGHNLVRESVKVFSNSKLRGDFRQNMTSIFKFIVFEYFGKARAGDGCLSRHWTVPFFFSLRKQLRPLKRSNLYWIALFAWCLTGVRLVWWLGTKFNLKAAMSPLVFRLKLGLRSLFRKIEQDAKS
jgi:glycosyltransferase involved in cell wall biosynthesis